MKTPILLLIATLTAASVASGQSVADAARANQQNKPSSSGTKKVYTNDDIGSSHQDADSASTLDLDKEPAPRDAKQKEELARKIAADILKQKKQVTGLQEHLARLNQIGDERARAQNEPIVTAATCQNEPERCETRRQAALDLARTNSRLAEAKQKLEQTQEKARKLGYPASVWDPE